MKNWVILLAVAGLLLLFLRLVLQLIGYLRLLRHPKAEPLAVPRLLTVEELARREIEESTGGH